MAENSGLPSIILDPRNEDQLTQEAKLYAFERSGGLLNSTNEGDPLDVMIRSQAYAAAEMLFYASQTPLAFAVKFLEQAGVQRSPGTKARATVKFKLVSTRPVPFFIPAGFEVTGQGAGQTLSFFTTDDLTILSGEIEGTVSVEAKAIGTAYNIAVINRFTQPLAFLQSVINTEPAQGGTDPESVESAVQRGIASLRRRSPIAESDFEEYAETVLGVGSRAKAIALLALNKIDFEKGAVHVFLFSATGKPANASEQQTVYNFLAKDVQLGTKLFISPMEILNINARMIARIEDSANPDDVADGIWAIFQDYLSPTQYTPGATLDPEELAHQWRFSSGVAYIEEVYLNDDTLPIAMSNDWTLPIAYGLVLELVDEAGVNYTLIRGSGEPPTS